MKEEFTTKDMWNLLYEDLSKIQEGINNTTEVILQKPNVESTFPCKFINTPLDSVLKAEDGKPLLKEFKISIEHWADNQEKCMQILDDTDKILQERNILRTSTQSIVYDDTLKKYNLTVIYGVRWESLTNSFIYIK